ncbi:MAG: hypothetical protein ACTHN5_19565 [Phycisphaerae bacterium]
MTTDLPTTKRPRFAWVFILIALLVAGGIFYWATWTTNGRESSKGPGAQSHTYNTTPAPVSNDNAVQTPPAKAEANNR